MLTFCSKLYALASQHLELHNGRCLSNHNPKSRIRPNNSGQSADSKAAKQQAIQAIRNKRVAEAVDQYEKTGSSPKKPVRGPKSPLMALIGESGPYMAY